MGPKGRQSQTAGASALLSSIPLEPPLRYHQLTTGSLSGSSWRPRQQQRLLQHWGCILRLLFWRLEDNLILSFLVMWEKCLIWYAIISFFCTDLKRSLWRIVWIPKLICGARGFRITMDSRQCVSNQTTDSG